MTANDGPGARRYFRPRQGESGEQLAQRVRTSMNDAAAQAASTTQADGDNDADLGRRVFFRESDHTGEELACWQQDEGEIVVTSDFPNPLEVIGKTKSLLEGL